MHYFTKKCIILQNEITAVASKGGTLGSIILGVEGCQWLALDNCQVTWPITFDFMA